ncbi:universal stress protein [Luedemannella flava]|uniref:universal stress protein n=1 Tax=Luedemannella flava TaxID=349316 RepID=UPI00361094CF
MNTARHSASRRPASTPSSYSPVRSKNFRRSNAVECPSLPRWGGRAATVLTAAARRADLLVLGSHGHSRTWHTVLGSVTEECVRNVTCPIVVLPDQYEQTTGSTEPGAPAHAEPS